MTISEGASEARFFHIAAEMGFIDCLNSEILNTYSSLRIDLLLLSQISPRLH